MKTLKHEVKADFLLDKGMELLWFKGYHATSVNDIVAEAGVPKGSFYFYFDSKEDFAVRALEKYFDDRVGPVLELLENTSVSPKKRILNFYEFRTKMLKEELDCKMGCLACNIGNEMAEHSERIRKTIATKEKLVQSAIVDVVSEAQDSGEIGNTMNPGDLTAFMEDAGKGAMITMKEMNSAYPIDNYMNFIRRVLLR